MRMIGDMSLFPARCNYWVAELLLGARAAAELWLEFAAVIPVLRSGGGRSC